MAKKVIDPALLEQLNGEAPAEKPATRRKVADPEVLKALQGEDRKPISPTGGKGAQSGKSMADTISQNEAERRAGYKPSAASWLDPVNAFGTALAENIPIVGKPLADFGNQVDASFASLFEGRPVTAEERAQITQSEQDAFPVASVGGAVAGNVLPLGAVGMTKTGGTLLGMTGPMWQRMVMGGGSGGAITFADALADGQSVDQAALEGAVGIAAGTAAPWVERGMSAVYQALRGRRPGADRRLLATAAERDQLDLTDLMRQTDQMGPDAMLADMGPNLMRQAGAIAALPGQGQSTVRNALVQRQLRTNPRIQADVDAVMGPAPVPSQIKAGIRENQETLVPMYGEALSRAPSGDISDLARRVDIMASEEKGATRAALRKARALLDYTPPEVPGLDPVTVLDPNPAGWLKARQALDDMISEIPEGTRPNLVRQLTTVRRDLDQQLALHVPGIKDIDDRFAELARQREAVDTGQQLLDSGRTAVRPQELDTMVRETAIPGGQMMGPSGVPFRLSQGARAEIDRLVGTTANNLNALKSAMKGDGSWNRDRLVTLFGPDKADQLLNILEREVTFARTYNTVTQNSETAARLAAQKDIEPMELGRRSMGVLDLALRVPQLAANAAAKGRSNVVNSRVAAALASRPTPELIDQLIAARRYAARPAAVAPASAGLMLTNQ